MDDAQLDRALLALLGEFDRGGRAWRQRATANRLARCLKPAAVSGARVYAALQRLHRAGRVVRIERESRWQPPRWRLARDGEAPGTTERLSY